MSMHMEGPWLSTTSTRKRAEKLTKSRREEVERDWKARNKWLIELHLPKQTFEQYLDWLYGRGEKNKTETKNVTKYSSTTTTKVIKKSSFQPTQSIFQSGNKEISEGPEKDIDVAVASHPRIWVTGPCTTKQTPTYTGTKILGIGTMHKSNMVPIFSDDEAKEISSMRR